MITCPDSTTSVIVLQVGPRSLVVGEGKGIVVVEAQDDIGVILGYLQVLHFVESLPSVGTYDEDLRGSSFQHSYSSA